MNCASERSGFSQWKSFLPSLIFTTVKGWGEEETCTKGVSNRKKEGEERGGGILYTFHLPLHPSPTVHSNNSTSNIPGRINDRELITLIRPSKTPALQAK